MINNSTFKINNRRYIGSKEKLCDWIFSIIDKDCQGEIFFDVFAGTGVVTYKAIKRFSKIIMNDFLHSNYVIYDAFFNSKNYDKIKIEDISNNFNLLKSNDLKENYFSQNFGGKYFSNSDSKKIGYIREEIELISKDISKLEKSILLASLIYSIDRIANTVGHYEAYRKKEKLLNKFNFKLIFPLSTNNVSYYKEDSNNLAKKIKSDIAYIDPPYNSRQYSRFYHLIETLVKWDKSELYGVALKPKTENISEYCKTNAKNIFSDLICSLNSKYLVTSYNNTYNSKSGSSRNKITLEDIRKILTTRGQTKEYCKEYKFFSAGKTDFKNHKEYLFVTKTDE